MAMESGKEQTENHTLASGKTRKHKATECMYGVMVTSMKANGMAA